MLSVGSTELELFRTSSATFITNEGQWADDSVRYAFLGDGANVLHTDAGPVIQLFKQEEVAGPVTDDGPFDPMGGRGRLLDELNAAGNPAETITRAVSLSVTFDDAAAVEPLGVDLAETRYNFLLGEQDSWRVGVASYQTVAYPGLYDGIDLLTFGRRNSLKYEFHVSPGADWSQIQVTYAGSDGLWIDELGRLRVTTELGELVDDAPYIYQLIDGVEVEVAGQFELIDADTYTFAVTGEYDSARELLIDPDLDWGSYLGGSSTEYARGVATDGSGGVYVVGETGSSGWVSGGWDTSHGGSYDGFVVKLSSSGAHQWSSYLGGSSTEYAWGVATDGSGGVYVCGATDSSGWVSGGWDTSYGGYRDGFVVKLSSSGAHQWSSYLGSFYNDYAHGVATDGSGGVYVCGYTNSNAWVSGGWDTSYEGSAGFVVKLSAADGAHQWSSYLKNMGAIDTAFGVATDGSGAAYVCGETFNGEYSDGFVVKLSSSGAHQWSTYLGGSNDDYAQGVATDGAGGVYVCGFTESSGWVSGGWDTSYGEYSDGFVVKLSSSGAHQWSTYLGGSDLDSASGVATDGSGDVYVSGYTWSSGWVSGGWDTSYGGHDGFVVKLSAADGAHQWSSYLGGSGYDLAVGVATDGSGSVYVCGETGSSGWVSGGWDTSYGGYDGFVVKVQEDAPPFEILAKGVAYENWAPGQPITYGGVTSYTVSFAYSDRTGVYVMGLLSGLYGPCLVCRGSEFSPMDWGDVWTNLNPVGVGFSQFVSLWNATFTDKDDKLQTLSTWLTENGPADIVGHSLGGALAQWIAAAYTSGGEVIDELFTFNSPGINAAYAALFVPELATSVIHYITSGDPVSLAGEAFVGWGENCMVLMAKYSDPSPTPRPKHSRPVTVPSIGTMNRASDITWQIISIADLNDANFCYHDAEYDKFLLGSECFLLSIEDKLLSYGLPPLFVSSVPALLMYRGTTEGARQEIGRVLKAADMFAEDIGFTWSVDDQGNHVLSLNDAAGIYKSLLITVTPDFTLTFVQGGSPSLQFDGGLSVALGNGIVIGLPSWLGLGESIDCNHLIEMPDLDFAGVLDFDHLVVHGHTTILGGLAEADGVAQLDWSKGEYTLSGAFNIANGFVTFDGLARRSSDRDLMIRGAGRASVPYDFPWRWLAGAPIGSAQFLLNRVNNETASDDFLVVWGSADPLAVGLQVWFDGRWQILLGARKIDAVVGERGLMHSESYVIDPDTEWTLFTADWANSSTTATLSLRTPSGRVLSRAEIEADSSMEIVTGLTDENGIVVRIDEPEAGTWTVTINDTADLGTANISAFVSNCVPSVSVVSVTDGLLREPVQIGLDAFDADSDAQISLFYDTDNTGYDGVMITSGIAETDGPAQYEWDTTGVAAGEYYVYAMIMDGVNPPVFAYSSSSVSITDWALVVDRLVYYNNSCWDDSGSGNDENAVAVDKTALLPGEIATAENHTAYGRGINGIMIDVAALPAVEGTIDPTNYFAFAAGNDDTPGDWSPYHAVPTVAILRGEGLWGSDRIVLTWPDYDPNHADTTAVCGQWLEVTVLANEYTGLRAPDVFYFGNLAGDATGDGQVSAADASIMAANWGARINPLIPGDANDDGIVDQADATVLAAHWGMSDMTWSEGDFNNDGVVNAADASIMAASWGATWAVGAAVQSGDFNGDGQVNAADAVVLAGSWGRTLVALTILVLPGDADGSGTVDAEDAKIMASNWGKTSMTWADGDFNVDGVVNAIDAAILAAHYGMTLPPPGAETPSEPSAPAEPVIVDASPFVGPLPVGNTPVARQPIQPVQRMGGLGSQQRAHALRSPDLRSPEDLLIEIEKPSESSTAALDTALAEEYGPATEQSSLLNRHAVWSSMVARRQASRREDPILGRAALAVDLLLAE